MVKDWDTNKTSSDYHVHAIQTSTTFKLYTISIRYPSFLNIPNTEYFPTLHTIHDISGRWIC